MANNTTPLDEFPLWLPSNLDANGEPLPGEPQYTPRVDRRLIETAMTEGVGDRGAQHMLVKQRAAGANMSVEIKPGFAGVTADGQAYAGRYLAIANAVQTLQIEDPPASGSRIDRIVVRVLDSSIAGTENQSLYEAVKGVTVTTGTPLLPVIGQSAVELAQILVTATVGGQPRVSITDADITDVRDQARSPLGVTDTGVALEWPPTRAPSVWPVGMSTLNVTEAAGWPVNGHLLTVKTFTPDDAGQRLTQYLNSPVKDVPLIWRTSEYNGTTWVWGNWSGVPSRPVSTFDAAAFAKGTAGWIDGITPIVPLVRTGPEGILEVDVSATIAATGSTPRGWMSFRVETPGGSVVSDRELSKAIGVDAVLTLAMGRSIKVENLTPFTGYTIRSCYFNGGGMTTWSSRRLKVKAY